MRAERRGMGALGALIALASLSIVFQDLIIALSALSVLAALIVDSLALELLAARFREELSRVEPLRIDTRIIAGSERRIELKHFPKEEGVSLRSNERWVEIEEDPEGLTIVIRPQISGSYEIDGLRALIRSPFWMFSKELVSPPSVKVRALPRATPLIVEALRALSASEGEGTGLGEGTSEIPLPLGNEYVGSREYIVGDSPKRIDWKATARIQDLIVKEFSEERGGAGLIFCPASLGRYTADMLFSAALSAALAFSKAGVPVTYLLIEDGNFKVSSVNSRPDQVLRDLLVRVMRELELSEPDFLEYVVPKPSRRLIRYLLRLKDEGLKEAVKRRYLKVNEVVEGPLKGAGVIAYAGTAVINTDILMDLAHELSIRGKELIALIPPKPWLDAQTLDEAYRIYETQKRVLKALRKYTGRIVLSYEEIRGRIIRSLG